MSDADEDLNTNGLDEESDTGSHAEEDEEAFGPVYLQTVIRLRNQSFELPETVSLLDCPNGTKVYIVGTAHFSEESIREVSTVISKVHPDFVLLELCPNRVPVLDMDEETIMEDLKKISLSTYIKTQGLSHGLLQYLMLRLNAHLTKTLGMAPGGEFRAAAKEASKQPHCHIVLGDRPVSVTLQRAFNALGPWSKLRLAFSLLSDLGPITKEQIEAMKQTDLLEQMLLEMAGDHPELAYILVDERDMYLAKSIWSTTGMSDYKPPSVAPETPNETDSNNTRLRLPTVHTPFGDCEASKGGGSPLNSRSCCPYWPSPSILPRVVVAVVGIGHMSGIKRHWQTAGTIDQRELMLVMEPPLSWKVFKWTMRAVLVSSIVGVGYGTVCGARKLCTSLWRLWK